MLILSRVCADFYSAGKKIFSVTPSTMNTFVEAPEEIRADPLFRMMIDEGSLTAGITEAKKRALENDPMAGHDASGEKLRPEAPPDGEPVPAPAPEPAPRSRKPAAEK